MRLSLLICNGVLPIGRIAGIHKYMAFQRFTTLLAPTIVSCSNGFLTVTRDAQTLVIGLLKRFTIHS